jgi:hypothetical protein
MWPSGVSSPMRRLPIIVRPSIFAVDTTVVITVSTYHFSGHDDTMAVVTVSFMVFSVSPIPQWSPQYHHMFILTDMTSTHLQ